MPSEAPTEAGFVPPGLATVGQLLQTKQKTNNSTATTNTTTTKPGLHVNPSKKVSSVS